jgi:hypothetical protein
MAVQKNPWGFPAVDGCPNPPPEWVIAAWDINAVQTAVADDLARDVSKNGELLSGQGFLARLSLALSTEQVVRLFRYIRDRSPHRESEFRPQFEAAFAAHSSALPQPQTRDQVMAALGVVGFDEAGAEALMREMPPDPEHEP